MCEMQGSRVSRLEEDHRIATLWQNPDPGRGGPNDIVVARDGSAFFTMPRHRTVYRIANDDSVEPWLTDLGGINGVILSRDEKTLFITEYKAREVYAVAIDPSGDPGERGLFAKIVTEGTEHGADGMAVDTDGNLFVCCLDGIWIYDSDGKEIGQILLRGERVTNCAFDDSESSLYITTQQGLFRAGESRN